MTLSRASSTQAFWRTISLSNKPASFFAEYVKVLCISEEAHTAYISQILFACSGVSCVTFWTIPASHWQNNLISANGLGEVTRSNSNVGPRLFLPQSPPTANHAKHNLFPDDCFNAIRPKRVVASFRDPRVISSQPDFTQPLFAFVTHLSILNAWEEWIFWDNVAVNLPSLTHLAFDLNLARTRLTDDSGRGTQSEEFTRKLASTVKSALHKYPPLRVCVLVHLFDRNPRSTMVEISRTLLDLERQELKVRFPLISAPAVPDHRLVFVKSTQPFAVRQAHSSGEEKMWRMAENMVVAQEKGSTGERHQ